MNRVNWLVVWRFYSVQFPIESEIEHIDFSLDSDPQEEPSGVAFDIGNFSIGFCVKWTDFVSFSEVPDLDSGLTPAGHYIEVWIVR